MVIPGREFDLKDCQPRKSKSSRRAYRVAHPYCLACGVPEERAPWPCLAVHHLVKPGRSDEPTNLMVLCHFCHLLCHGHTLDGGLYGFRWVIGSEQPRVRMPSLTLGMQFNLKRLRDPSSWRPDRLAQLWGRHLPDLEALPEVFVSLYESWRPDCVTNGAVREACSLTQGV